MEKVKIGNVEITPLLDTGLLMDPKFFLPQHADQMLKQYADHVDERGLMRMSITCYLVRSGGRTMLVDTGLGNRRRENFPVGHLDDALKGAGVAPEDIDVVLNTHLHIDHVGWNTVEDAAGKPKVFFPRAEFWVQQTEWDFWMTPAQMAEPGNAHLGQCVAPLKEAGKLKLVSAETAIAEGVTFVPAPGHTPGHVAIGLYSNGQRGVIVGDASHHPAQLDHPDWSPAFDTDPVQSSKTRDKMFDEAAADGRTWLAGHWPQPGGGRIVRLQGKRVFKAL